MVNKMDKKLKKKIKKYHWLFILIITVFVAMWIYGMTEHYFPLPVNIGAGQYLDIGMGIVIIALLFSGIVIGFLFKKKKKRKL